MSKREYYKEFTFIPDTDSEILVHVESNIPMCDEVIEIKVKDCDLKTKEPIYRLGLSLVDAQILHDMLSDAILHQESMLKGEDKCCEE